MIQSTVSGPGSETGSTRINRDAVLRLDAVFSWVNLVLVDKFGRRIILSITVLGMAICMIVAVVAVRYIPVNTDTLALDTQHVGWPGTLVLVAIICYVACFSSGVATIAWIGTELIPLEVRAVGTMLVRTRLHLLPSFRWHTDAWIEYRDMLEYQHHHCVDIPLHDEKLDP